MNLIYCVDCGQKKEGKNQRGWNGIHRLVNVLEITRGLPLVILLLLLALFNYHSHRHHLNQNVGWLDTRSTTKPTMSILHVKCVLSFFLCVPRSASEIIANWRTMFSVSLSLFLSVFLSVSPGGAVIQLLSTPPRMILLFINATMNGW